MSSVVGVGAEEERGDTVPGDNCLGERERELIRDTPNLVSSKGFNEVLSYIFVKR